AADASVAHTRVGQYLQTCLDSCHDAARRLVGAVAAPRGLSLIRGAAQPLRAAVGASAPLPRLHCMAPTPVAGRGRTVLARTAGRLLRADASCGCSARRRPTRNARRRRRAGVATE